MKTIKKYQLFYEKSIYQKNPLIPILANLVQTTIKHLQIEPDFFFQINIFSTEKMEKINEEIYPFKSVSDVLALPTSTNIWTINKKLFLGEIFLNWELIQKQAKKNGHTWKREICFLTLHGLLHLLGYHHFDLSNKKLMFGLTNEILEILKINRY